MSARLSPPVRWLFILTLLLSRLFAARADGPHIAFHATKGPYTVTLFSAPDPLVTGPVQLRLLVQRASDGSLLRAAAASGELTLPSRPSVLSVPFELRGSSSDGLPAAAVRLGTPGEYQLVFSVREAGKPTVRFEGALPVEVNHGKRDTVLWAVLLPAGLAALFLVNQYAKQRMRRRPESRTGQTGWELPKMALDV